MSIFEVRMWPLSVSGVAKKPVLDVAYGNQSHIPYAVGGMFVGLFASVAVNTLSNRSRPQPQRSGEKPRAVKIGINDYRMRFKDNAVDLKWVSTLQEIFDLISVDDKRTVSSGGGTRSIVEECRNMADFLNSAVAIYANDGTYEPPLMAVCKPTSGVVHSTVCIVEYMNEDGKNAGLAHATDDKIIHYKDDVDSRYSWFRGTKISINKPSQDIQDAARIEYP
jgi:hypothetical protein